MSNGASSDKFQLLLYAVEAPLMLRFKRFQAKHPSAKGASSLEEFVRLDDHVNFSSASERNVRIIRTFINNEESADLFFLSLASKIESI
jgi:hypothetical protein